MRLKDFLCGLLLVAAFLPTTMALAVIHGLPLPALATSTIRLQIQHEHYLRSLGTWEYYESICSAVIVGRKPLTVLTAAHCLREVRLAGGRELPMVQIAQSMQSGLSDVRLRQAYYRPYEDLADDLALDLAVLVFDAKVAAYVQPLEVVIDSETPETLLICGYGRASIEQEVQQPRCAERPVLRPDEDFSKVLPLAYQPQDEMLYIKSQAQFDYTRELVHNEDVLLAVNRLNDKREYDPRIEIPTVGDSGGPWLKMNAQGQYGVYAITSLVERFYNQSTQWRFFDRNTPLVDYPYVAYGLRLGHPMVMNYLQFVRNSGADMHFVWRKNENGGEYPHRVSPR